ncbi:four helix bundle protein [candidate division LCP-89 bacterium B3_LCP]|uniref:Four helix bundle protein n=1 Tax=candidate division LCP-89 bacterium B3_LCP TaxID=2012998 RepID=A0A532UYG9_UNCL8|nr:MAG: four helix bundle protein [candidate division LCP-89 bacterium B3_LCP]
MKIDKTVISERLLDLAAGTIKLTTSLEKTYTGRHVSGQLMRSATSAGANYEEACGAESRKDFLHKMQIVLKELRESLYWIRLIEKADLNASVSNNLNSLLSEAQELTNIIAKSIITAKKNK